MFIAERGHAAHGTATELSHGWSGAGAHGAATKIKPNKIKTPQKNSAACRISGHKVRQAAAKTKKNGHCTAVKRAAGPGEAPTRASFTHEKKTVSPSRTAPILPEIQQDKTISRWNHFKRTHPTSEGEAEWQSHWWEEAVGGEEPPRISINVPAGGEWTRSRTLRG